MDGLDAARVLGRPPRDRGALGAIRSPAGLLIWLQMISSVYYGAFLGVIVAALAGLLLVSNPRQARGADRCRSLSACSSPRALTLPYAIALHRRMRASSVLAIQARSPTFSAHLDSYFLTPQQNWFWGWTAFKFGGNELHLFPGVAAIGLSLFARRQPRREVWIYLALGGPGRRSVAGVQPADLSMAQRPRVGVARVPRAGAFCHPGVVRAGRRSPALVFRRSRRVVVPPFMRRGLLVAVLVADRLECGSAPMILADVPTKRTGRLQVSADPRSIRHRRIPDGRLRHDAAVHVRLDLSLAPARERLQRLHAAGLPRDTRAHAQRFPTTRRSSG